MHARGSRKLLKMPAERTFRPRRLSGSGLNPHFVTRVLHARASDAVLALGLDFETPVGSDGPRDQAFFHRHPEPCTAFPADGKGRLPGIYPMRSSSECGPDRGRRPPRCAAVPAMTTSTMPMIWMAVGVWWRTSTPSRTPMAGSMAIRVPNAADVMCRRASSSNAKGRTGCRIANPAADGEDAEGEMTGGLGDSGDGGGECGDRDGDGESAEAGEPVADLLGEQDVGGPADGGEGGEPETGGVDVALPGFGEQHYSEQCQGRPGQCPFVVAADGGDGQRAEEFDRDGGAERDAFDRGEECDGHQPGGDAQSQQRRHIVPAYRAQRGTGQCQEDQCSHAEPEPRGAGRSHSGDQVDRQGRGELDRQHGHHRQGPGGTGPVAVARVMTVSGFASRRSRSAAAVAGSRLRCPGRGRVRGGW